MSEPNTNPPIPPASDPRIRTLRWLAGAALVAVLAAALAQGLSRERTGRSFQPRLAFPGFEDAVSTVARVEIHSRDAHFTLVKGDDGSGWGVAERGGYPVRPEELRALLWGLGDMELVERKTARAERHETVGLVAPEAGGEAVRIRALTGENVLMAAVLFGNPEGAETLDGRVLTWARMDGEDQTWLSEGRLEIEAALEEWMDLDFLDVDAARIASVHTTPGAASQGSEAFTIARKDTGTYNYELLDLYDGEQMSGPTAANGLGRALIAMTFSDAMPASDIGFDDAAIARYETFDGLALTLRTVRFEEDYWITLEAEAFDVEPFEAEAGENGSTSVDGETEAVETTDAAPRDVAAEADRINTRADDWAFRIPEWKGGQLSVARASMIKQPGEESNDNE